MDDIYFKIIALCLILLGEAVAIVAELFSAKTGNNFLRTFLIGFGVAIISGAFLISGYMLGFKSFKNIWIVSAISILSIFIIEPLLDFSIFNQSPTKGAFIGLILGMAGFVSAVFIK